MPASTGGFPCILQEKREERKVKREEPKCPAGRDAGMARHGRGVGMPRCARILYAEPGEAKAFPWRGRCHGLRSVTDEVEGNSVVPTYGDNRWLRPHQSQLTLRQRSSGMTATGSHTDSYSLRGAPPSRGSLHSEVRWRLLRIKAPPTQGSLSPLCFCVWNLSGRGMPRPYK